MSHTRGVITDVFCVTEQLTSHIVKINIHPKKKNINKINFETREPEVQECELIHGFEDLNPLACYNP